jgi:hypothetical protein
MFYLPRRARERAQVAAEVHDGAFVRSIYFEDPGGVLVEFAAWTRPVGQPGDVRHEPRTAAERTI